MIMRLARDAVSEAQPCRMVDYQLGCKGQKNIRDSAPFFWIPRCDGRRGHQSGASKAPKILQYELCSHILQDKFSAACFSGVNGWPIFNKVFDRLSSTQQIMHPILFAKHSPRKSRFPIPKLDFRGLKNWKKTIWANSPAESFKQFSPRIGQQFGALVSDRTHVRESKEQAHDAAVSVRLANDAAPPFQAPTRAPRTNNTTAHKSVAPPNYFFFRYTEDGVFFAMCRDYCLIGGRDSCAVRSHHRRNGMAADRLRQSNLAIRTVNRHDSAFPKWSRCRSPTPHCTSEIASRLIEELVRSRRAPNIDRVEKNKSQQRPRAKFPVRFSRVPC